jgi:hypothetical protein
MTFEQLLKEEEEIIFEKRISNLNKKRKRNQERENDAADEKVELSPEMKRKLRAHKHPDWQDDGGVKFKPGRERTVAAVRNLCAKKGKTISTKQARDYIYEKFVEWDNREKGAKWIMNLENYAKKNLGYDPRKYAHIKKGDTVGLGGPGDPEYEGRAYFFTALINGFANHFLKQKPKYKPWKESLKKHKKDVKNRKAQERAQR